MSVSPMSIDTPVRPAFWNVPIWGEIGVYVLGLLAVALCAWGVWKQWKIWTAGRAIEKDPARVRRAADTVMQKRVVETKAGRVHAMLVVGFFLLFLGTATATLDWDVGHYVFGQQFLRGSVYLAYKLILDIAGVAVLLALGLGAWRRWKSDTLERSTRFVCVYASLALIVISGYVVEALRLAVQQPAWSSFSPVGHLLAQGLIGFGPAALEAAHVVLWVAHGIAALAFIAAIPLTFYGHLYRQPLAAAMRKADAPGTLAPIADIEEQETFGLSAIEQLKPEERIQLAGCVECGRCDDVCPAVRAGTPLKPRTIIMKLRSRAEARERGLTDEKTLVGDVVTHDELFSCTTCGACARACPAEIQTPDFIVAMRRHLALEQGEFPEGAAAALENTASVGNPWGMDPYERMDWAKDLDVPLAEPGKKVDVLYWVGCAASYDRRARRIARAMVRIFRAAGVDFAVMPEERCHGEFARRLGEEYLYQTAAQENLEAFAGYDFNRIVAACPHCFHTLKNEYPLLKAFSELEMGELWKAVDHATFIRELIDASRLPLSNAEALETLATVYHDPCYLARHNGITEAPRRVLDGVLGTHTEPVETGEKALCCGAGGGQIWCETRAPKPVNVIRLDALKATGAKRIAVSCPHCLTMLESAKATARDDATRVEDIAEIVAAALTERAEPAEGVGSEPAE